LLGAALFWQYGLAYDFMRRGQSDENLANLTGRVGYWQVSLEALRERLPEGYGANVGGRHVLQDALAGKGATTTHSTWVEVLLDTGAVGFVLFAVGLIATWFWLFKFRSRAMGDPISRMLWFECLGVLAVMSVRSVFSVVMVWSFNVITFGVVLVFLSVMRRQAVEARHSGVSFAQPVPATRRRRSGIRG
jgi:O-antigen ligase